MFDNETFELKELTPNIAIFFLLCLYPEETMKLYEKLKNEDGKQDIT